MTILSVLSKMGLVVSDKVAETKADPAADPANIDKMAEAVDAILGDITILPHPVSTDGDNAVLVTNFDTPLDVVYKNAGILPVPYSAEKLLRLLDGLKMMDPLSRKAAVLALDAADDDWSIDGVVTDARNKILALEGAKTTLKSNIIQLDSKLKSEIASNDSYLLDVNKTIRDQISELEKQLADETESVRVSKAKLQEDYNTLFVSATREESRLNLEITKLKDITTAFAVEVKND